MPTYTDQASGVTIRSDGPLSPEELDAAFAPTPENIQRYAVNEGRKLGIPPETVMGVVGTESGGDVNAVSPKGARGAMQVMPGTAEEVQRKYGVDMADPFGRVKGGLLYLRDQYEDFGDPKLALAAYNAGPGAVRQYGGVPPYEETQKYVAAIPTEGWVRRDTAPSSTMPLMSDAADPVDRRTGQDKAVDVPDGQALAFSLMAKERDAQSLPKRLASLALDPIAELGIAGVRKATGSTLPIPPTDRLVTDAAQAATLIPGLGLGRLGTAALLATGGVGAGVQQAAERHVTTGEDLRKQADAMDQADYVTLGLNTVMSSVLGAALPLNRGTATSPMGAINRGREQLGSMMARETADMALPPARSAEVTAAFGKLDRALDLDATSWARVLVDWDAAGKSIPNEIRAIANRLRPQTAPRAVVPGMAPVVTPTGGFRATLGDLLDANRALGSMVNTRAGRLAAEASGHNLDNLTALRGALSDAVEGALPTGRDLVLYRAARETSKQVAQSNAGMRLVEKYLNPTEGIADGAGLYAAMTGGQRERMIKTMGLENYTQLKEFAESIKGVTRESGKWLAAALRPAFSASWPNVALAGGGAYYGGVQGAGLALGARVLYGLATSRPMRALVDEAARHGPRTARGLAAIGRLTAATQTLRNDLARQYETEQPAALRQLGLAP